ncbi:MAG: helix-turn-helix domain-containing protein [Roseiflexaceae bacterium]|nr:helix-turn-helix domain-containing protein [Roseiflexaceae bacterium]
MITTRQAAQRLGVTERQVQRYVHAGQLQAQQLGNYSTAPWAIDEASLEHYIATRAQQRKQQRPVAPTTGA